MSGCVIEIFLEKMAKLFANSGDPDQTLHSAAFNLCLHCLPITFFWLKEIFEKQYLLLAQNIPRKYDQVCS